MVQVECDARGYQGVAGEFNAFTLEHLLDRYQHGSVSTRYAFLRLIAAQCLQTDSTPLGQI